MPALGELMNCDVFISYSHQDIKAAIKLKRALGNSKAIWFDRDHSAGDRFSDEIPFRIIGAKVVVVLWSKHSVASAWVRSEARQALNLGKLVSFSLDGSMPPSPLNVVHCEQVEKKRWWFDNVWSAPARSTRKRVKTRSAPKNVMRKYAAFQSLAAEMRTVVDQAQSARLNALTVERTSYSVEAGANSSLWHTERQMKGYRRTKDSDGTVRFYQTKEYFFRWAAHGYGLVRHKSFDYCSDYVEGEPSGVAVFNFHVHARPPDRIAVTSEMRNGKVEFSGHGVLENFEGPRFEGQLVDQNPSGYGVFWRGDGGFEIGRFQTDAETNTYKQFGAGIIVHPNGDAEKHS